MEAQDRCIKNDAMNPINAGKIGETKGLTLIYKMNRIHFSFIPKNFFSF